MVHELSVCQALLAQVTDIAALHGARGVTGITVEVGPLCGVEPLLLVSAFAVMRTGSCAAAAVLSIDTAVVRISCLTCRAQSEVAPNRLVCLACGGYRARVVSGAELRLRRVELQNPEACGESLCVRPVVVPCPPPMSL